MSHGDTTYELDVEILRALMPEGAVAPFEPHPRKSWGDGVTVILEQANQNTLENDWFIRKIRVEVWDALLR